MSIIFNDLLKNISKVIDIYQKNNELYLDTSIANYEKCVRDKYNKIMDNDMLASFYNFLRKEFSAESEIYILLLSIIYRCTKSESSLKEILNFLATSKIEMMDSILYTRQIERCIFANSNIRPNYELRRKIHKIQIEQLEKKYNCRGTYIPYVDRNEDRVVIITNQLLEVGHAPTRNILEICRALQSIGKEVLLIVAVETDKMSSIRLKEIWYDFHVQNYKETYMGIFNIPYYGFNINGMQFILTEENGINISDVITFIYDYNPQFLWYMGGTSLFADLFRKVTTVVSMPFSDGHIISEAPILVEYMNSGSEDVKIMERYIEKQEQTILHLNFEQPIHPSNYTYCRSDFGLKDDDFIISITGNRLNDDITKDVIKVLNSILALSDKIHIVFIGNMDKLSGLVEQEKVSYLGFQKDLIGILGLFDLFINPPRKGGGTGAYWALYNSIPVVTLDHCDVANCVTNEFICENLNEMISIVARYYNDSVYYQDMKVKAKNIINKIEEENNLPQNLQKLISAIKEETIKREKLLLI